ncbi:MAG TPA: chorismate-binding protein [Thermoanaerobaculia bacterium]|nr:chorismate-binding protein [Thermoanaerobaculia bacterium]
MNFESLRSQYDIVPVVRELSADALTPLAAFNALAGSDTEAFLFESVERGENVGRYSFVGFDPRRTLRFDRGTNDPARLLREELVPLRVYVEEQLPPFFGGAVGYFGYGVGGWSERIPDTRPDDINAPDAKLLFFDNVVVFDHVRQKMLVVANLFTADAHASLDEANTRIERAIEKLKRASIELLEFPTSPSSAFGTFSPKKGGRRALDSSISREAPIECPSPPVTGEKVPKADEGVRAEFASTYTRGEFEQMVRDAKEEIVAGEIFQIVVSQRWDAEYPTSEALTLYRVLRSINPSPYMFLLRTAECTLVGASPEMLVRVTGDVAETRPIAGTRKRGKTREEDAELEASLLADPKERAEHLMLVDLGRNDLGRVCASGSVEVENFCSIERYSHVIHLVTDVHGTLREGSTAVDVFLSAFPAGTLSGAPKIRAMELIDRFEKTRRGPYGGAVAYAGFSGNLDSCITIRTIVLANGRAYVQAGAGIVYDSDPATEFDETLNKSAALRQAVTVATGLLPHSR